MRSVTVLASLAACVVLGTALVFGHAGAEAATARAVNCADPPYNNVVSGMLEANLEISVHGTICLVTGTVEGNVTVGNDDPQCETRPPFVALDLEGGTIEGNVKAVGKRCVMVWLVDAATGRATSSTRRKATWGSSATSPEPRSTATSC